MRKVYILSFILLHILNAGAKKDIAICVNKNNDAERLICFDNIAKSLKVNEPKKEVIEDKGKWVTTIETSAIDDSQKVTLLLEAETPIQGNYNSSTPALILRCSENRTEAYISWGVYLGIGTTKVLTRLDKSKARTKTWGMSTDNKATFVPGSNTTFIKSLMGHEKLLIQTTPYGANSVMTTFQLNGLNDAVKPLRKACHW
ncbi:MAG: Type VI secretion system protein VasI [uncultured Sulfurovum sp.]|uniref:Type VI secretion system protein VasI n=1 Tax=uncultured Sulfurovum sp. TaxID=269237 RepID=A0A6S6SYK9_9BACT|nr:MAG: Type VI secretion system protein VasI [uncultured Sulfurovum sp.]